jgi:hypothetical protein
VGTDFNRKAAGMQSCVKISFPVIIAKENRVEGKESLKPITGGVCRTHPSKLDAHKLF